MNNTKLLKQLRTTYTKNMAALKKRYPLIAKKIENTADSARYRLHPNKDGKTFNLYINDLNQFYYDPTNSLYHVKHQIDQLELRNTRIALIFGMGLGYEAIYYLQSLAKEQRTGAVFIVERDIAMVAMAMHATDLVPLITNQHVHLIIDQSEDELFLSFQQLLTNSKYMTYVKAVNPVYYPIAFQLNKDYYMKALKSFKEAAVNVINFVGNSPEDSLIGIQNMFANMDTIIESPGINLLFDKFKNKPAVVVASGPSLKKNMHLLHDIGDKALILCAESTFRILMNQGIKPHMVASLERTDRTTFSFQGFDQDQVQDTYLAGCPVIPKKVYEIYEGPNLIVYRKFDHFKWLEIDKGMLDIKQSSANMAFKIAQSVGCNPIILIGQDLAFDQETKSTHADFHIKGSNQEIYHKQRTYEIKGNDGGTVVTTDSWMKFLKSYEVDIAEFQGKVINATEGGAYIHGTEIMPFKEAIDTFLKEDIFPLEIIKKEIRKFTVDDKIKDRQRLIEKIDKSYADIEKMVDFCHEGVAIIDEVDKELHSYLENDHIEKTDKYRIMQLYNKVVEPKNKLQNFSDTFQLLIMHVVQPIYIKFETDMNEIPSKHQIFEQGMAEIILRQRDWFAYINNLCIIVQDELKKAKEHMVAIASS